MNVLSVLHLHCCCCCRISVQSGPTAFHSTACSSQLAAMGTEPTLTADYKLPLQRAHMHTLTDTHPHTHSMIKFKLACVMLDFVYD